MPKQNRPVVRDGRLQRPKRTDRSYLRPAEAPVETPDAADDTASDAPEAMDPVATLSAAVPERTVRQAPRAATIAQPAARRRRELDVHALAERDTRYAIHELRRIAILATMVVVTLIVLGIVLR